METTQQKLDHLVSLGEQLNDWDRGFVESVADQYKQRNLSYGQIEVVNKILAKHSPEQIKARNAWRASYDEEKQALMLLAAEYYTANGPYFRDVAYKVLNDPAYIPTEKCFNKMTQNKYVQRWITQREAGPAFAKGQLGPQVDWIGKTFTWCAEERKLVEVLVLGSHRARTPTAFCAPFSLWRVHCVCCRSSCSASSSVGICPTKVHA